MHVHIEAHRGKSVFLSEHLLIRPLASVTCLLLSLSIFVAQHSVCLEGNANAMQNTQDVKSVFLPTWPGMNNLIQSHHSAKMHRHQEAQQAMPCLHNANSAFYVILDLLNHNQKDTKFQDMMMLLPYSRLRDTRGGTDSRGAQKQRGSAFR